MNPNKTVPLGELVTTAFDEAGKYSSDPHEVSRLATGAVMRMLRRARKMPYRDSTRQAPKIVRSVMPLAGR